MATKKSAVSGAVTSSPSRSGSKSKKASQDTPRSMPKAGKDPRGGLTAKGREYFNKTEGSHLRPGVKGAADTPEKMMRKGSFLRRHFAHPRGPMVDDKGRPTRLALSAQAWGEPLPKTMADAKRLADKGHQLLERYHAVQEKNAATSESQGKPAKKTAVKKTAAKKAAAKNSAKKAAAKKTASKKRLA